MDRGHNVIHAVKDYIQFLDRALAGLENILQGGGFGGSQLIVVLYRCPCGVGTVDIDKRGAEDALRRERAARVFAHVFRPVSAHLHDDFYRS